MLDPPPRRRGGSIPRLSVWAESRRVENDRDILDARARALSRTREKEKEEPIAKKDDAFRTLRLAENIGHERVSSR